MTQAHLLHRLGDPFWFFPVESGGATGFYGAKTATACANAAQDHEGRSSVSPAFADIGAARLLAHRVQLFAAHQLLEVFVVLSLWRAHPEPFRAALRYNGHHVVFLRLVSQGRGKPGPYPIRDSLRSRVRAGLAPALARIPTAL